MGIGFGFRFGSTSGFGSGAVFGNGLKQSFLGEEGGGAGIVQVGLVILL